MSEIIKESIIIEEAGSSNIANTDQDLSLPTLYQQMGAPSLAKLLFSSIELNGPTGALFNIRKKKDENSLELLRSDVEIFPSQPINTKVTTEVLEDIGRQFGLDGKKSVAVMLKGLANSQENEQLMTFLSKHAKPVGKLSMNGVSSFDNFYELTRKVSEEILLMNLGSVKTFRANVLLPYSVASMIMGYNSAGTSANTNTFYVGGCNLQSFYVNTDTKDNNIYIVLCDPYDASKSGAVYAPYQNEINLVQDAESGNYVYFIYNRYAFGISPLHSMDDPSIVKFEYVK